MKTFILGILCGFLCVISIGACRKDKTDTADQSQSASGVGFNDGQSPISGTSGGPDLGGSAIENPGQPSSGGTADAAGPPLSDSGASGTTLADTGSTTLAGTGGDQTDSSTIESDGGDVAMDDDSLCEKGPDGQPIIVADADCDPSKAPFVFIHGTYGSMDNIANVAMLFGSNGYCQDRFVAVNYNSLGENPDAELDQLVDRMIAETGHSQVVLAGHSQGTMHAATYMSAPERAQKISHYVNYSGVTEAPSPIPTLAVSSNNDMTGFPIYPTNFGGLVKEVNLGDEDHFANAASVDAFVETWKFLYDEEPQYKTIQCGQDPIVLAGIAISFGDNIPLADGTLEVYELDYNGAPRERGAPVMTIHSGSDGRIEPVELKRNVPYEFKGLDADGSTIGWVYITPFKRTNRLVTFYKPSDNPVVAGLSTDNINRGPNHMAMIARYLGGAFRYDLDNSLKINGQEILDANNASREGSVVGFFMYDDASQGVVGQSDLGALFGPAVFLVGTDVFVDATTPAWVTLEWYDPTNFNPPSTMKIPNWPSSEGLTLLYFQ